MARWIGTDGTPYQDEDPTQPGYIAGGQGPGGEQGPGAPPPAETAQEAADAAAGKDPIAEKNKRDDAQADADAKAKAAADAQAAQIAAINNHYNYGGVAGGANAAASHYGALGDAAQSRQGAQIDNSGANWDRQMAGYSRNEQSAALALTRARAEGQVPSIAQMEADRQIGQANAAQSSAAASARGPAMLALAQQGAAANTANVDSNISQQAQINAAHEREQAEQAYFGEATGMRSGDFQAGGMAAQQAQAQAQIDQNQHGLNDQFQQGMTQDQIAVQKAQLDAQMHQVDTATGAQTATGNRDAASNTADANRNTSYILPVIGGVASAVGAGLLGALGGGGSGKGDPSNIGGPGANGYNGNAPADGSLNPGTSGGSYGGGTYGPSGSSNGSGFPNTQSYSTPVVPGGSFGMGHPLETNGTSSTTATKPTLYSDERIKQGFANEGRHPLEGPNRVDAMLDGIHPLSYTYKDPASEPRSQPTGGRYLGISAQDLERVPEVGHQMVSEGPRGKQIEAGPTLSAAMAGLARLNERLKSVEGHGVTSDIRAKTDVANEGAGGAMYGAGGASMGSSAMPSGTGGGVSGSSGMGGSSVANGMGAVSGGAGSSGSTGMGATGGSVSGGYGAQPSMPAQATRPAVAVSPSPPPTPHPLLGGSSLPGPQLPGPQYPSDPIRPTLPGPQYGRTLPGPQRAYGAQSYGAITSDIRAKEDVVPEGRHPLEQAPSAAQISAARQEAYDLGVSRGLSADPVRAGIAMTGQRGPTASFAGRAAGSSMPRAGVAQNDSRAEEARVANIAEARAGRPPLTAGSMLPSDRAGHTGFAAAGDAVYDAAERATRPDTSGVRQPTSFQREGVHPLEMATPPNQRIADTFTPGGSPSLASLYSGGR